MSEKSIRDLINQLFETMAEYEVKTANIWKAIKGIWKRLKVLEGK